MTPLLAMVDGESKAGGCGPGGLRPCRDRAAPGTAGWPELCSAFHGQRVRLSRGCLPAPRNGVYLAGEPRVPAALGAAG